MPVTFVCPSCGEKVQGPNLPGKQVRCPSCRSLTTIPTAAAHEVTAAGAPTCEPTGGPAPIHFKCPSCGQSYKVPGRAAGKTRPCVKCGEIMRIPTPEVIELGLEDDDRAPPPSQAPAPAPQVVYHVIKEEAQKKRRGMSLGNWSLIFAFASFFVPILCIVAIVLGICGLVQQRDIAGSVAGIILAPFVGYVGLCFWIGFLAGLAGH